MKIKLPFILSKWFHFEFWPFWIFYFPVYGYGIYLAIKARSFSYFTATNPSMKFGGAFGMDKMKMLDFIDNKYIPKGFLSIKDENTETVCAKMAEHEFDFPVVCKPNVGERGIGVEKIDTKQDLNLFLQTQNEDILVQEFIDFPIELGVFYHRFPISSKDGITSIVRKEFLKITGNGKSRFSELVTENVRAKSRISYLKKKYHSKWNQIVPSGITYKLEPIGNHNRGTKFLDGNRLINDRLVNVFREIAQPLDGYYYGRFDLKVNSLEDLYNGNNIKIIELNGTNSEPAHIYDPDYSLFKAYQEIIKHMKLVFEISQENRKLGVQPEPFRDVLLGLIKHLFSDKSKK
ncbi:ATP-grasp domain-containing protein [Labilibaculum sp. A4]|uniref:ATP-grasp domain-containing protein n=1 Tax=Labilibaculum euxinus TaxID=2686357 RepID=UPI000F6262F6|nr:ATP-grasp domain-containing protein [Labilibaculum euxinus]MDQ1771828.1 ATP-grasp domain-containing protein [Labilibaculum euxinus]MWN77731.1 ATP-grasp domain-containing protein [Labilibaculum euxinus]